MSQFQKYLTKDKQKQKNLSDILYYIVEKGETTRREIERETGFSWGTVSESVGELLLRGYLREESSSDKTVGRTSTVLKLNGGSVVAVGLDINTTALSARVIGFDFGVQWEKTVPFTAKTQEDVLDMALSLCSEALGSVRSEQARVLCIGIAMQGEVDAVGGVSLHFPNVGEWKAVNMKELFEEVWGIPVTVEHDPKCLLFAKTVKEKLRDGILLRVDNGIGLSVIQNGSILDDCGRMEVGHTVVVPHGERCTCGRRGCLEAYASIRGLEERTGMTCEELLETDNPAVFEQACEHLSLSIYNLCMLFAPKRVILAGKLTESDCFVNTLTARFDQWEGMEQTELERASDLSAAFGAAVAAVRNAIKSNRI